MKKRLCWLVALASGYLVGCVYAPEHLPAFYAQRDQFQRFIDEIEGRMATDRAWWAGLTPQERERWRSYLEKACADEKERALAAIQTLNDGIALADSVKPASSTASVSPAVQQGAK